MKSVRGVIPVHMKTTSHPYLSASAAVALVSKMTCTFFFFANMAFRLLAAARDR